MKLRKTIKNWKLIEMDKRIYLPLEPIHLQLDLQIDLQKVKHKSPLRFFSHAVYHSPNASLYKWYLRPTAYVLFFISFQYRICDTSLWTLALCFGLGYSECTINNAYEFSICTSEVCF